MSTPGPTIIWERSDRLLSGATVAVRGVGLAEEDGMRSAVAVTVQVDGASCQVSDSGLVTATLLIGPAEALGVSRWLREAAQAVEGVGPPLLDWDTEAPSASVNAQPQTNEPHE